jgi:phosphotransferase system enzyme I (PtsP)
MIAETLPRLEAQTQLYREVLDAAGDRPVTFRTLDLGGDKVLPYVTADREENPALGWRALRIGLDRPALLRYQLRALIKATGGRLLRIMFPLVTTISEFEEARALVDHELAWCAAHGSEAPAKVEVGAMVEAPALAWSAGALKGKADFLSIGTNDLMQYFFAADRGNSKVSDRYDILSPSALSFLRHVRMHAGEANLPLSICGEAAGRPLEAMTFIALGFDRLSMPASGVGPVKRMILSLDSSRAAARVEELLRSSAASVREELAQFAADSGISV